MTTDHRQFFGSAAAATEWARQHPEGYVHPAQDAFRPDRPRRRLGRTGTAARLAVGSVLIVLALVYWDAGWLDLLVGLVVLPAVATLLMSLRGRSASTLRLGAAGHLVTLAHVTLTVLIVPDAAALFYGSMALVAGLGGSRGCEITAVANRLRGRDDQIGCPLFEPFDALDRRAAGRSHG